MIKIQNIFGFQESYIFSLLVRTYQMSCAACFNIHVFNIQYMDYHSRKFDGHAFRYFIDFFNSKINNVRFVGSFRHIFLGFLEYIYFDLNQVSIFPLCQLNFSFTSYLAAASSMEVRLLGEGESDSYLEIRKTGNYDKLERVLTTLKIEVNEKKAI